MITLNNKSKKINALFTTSLVSVIVFLIVFIIGICISNIIVLLAGLLLTIGFGFLFFKTLIYKSNLQKINAIYNYIVKNKIEEFNDIAEKTKLQITTVRNISHKLIKEKMLTDYIIVGEKIMLITKYNTSVDKNTDKCAVKCKYCGASYLSKKSTPISCPYCGNYNT